MFDVLPSRTVLSRQQMARWHNKLYNGHTQRHILGTEIESQRYYFLELQRIKKDKKRRKQRHPAAARNNLKSN